MLGDLHVQFEKEEGYSKHGMQSLGTDGETQTHALLEHSLAAVPSLLYPASHIFECRLRKQHPSTHMFLAANHNATELEGGYQGQRPWLVH
jgi:hypothetical protein